MKRRSCKNDEGEEQVKSWMFLRRESHGLAYWTPQPIFYCKGPCPWSRELCMCVSVPECVCALVSRPSSTQNPVIKRMIVVSIVVSIVWEHSGFTGPGVGKNTASNSSYKILFFSFLLLIANIWLCNSVRQRETSAFWELLCLCFAVSLYCNANLMCQGGRLTCTCTQINLFFITDQYMVVWTEAKCTWEVFLSPESNLKRLRFNWNVTCHLLPP